MVVSDLILKKRNGGSLEPGEIGFLIDGYVNGQIPDYQISALLMAIWFRGLGPEETSALTRAMIQSGQTIDLSSIPGCKVDKHSTGGVADTTTLICAPVVAACGARVAKMSGRGLGHTGGTLDKLEAIPGLNVEISMELFSSIVTRVGLCVTGQSADLVPADKMLYALRDVTGTVDNTGLIASSIMSKKLAAGSDAIVLDVKTGSGAFMKEYQKARDLALEMVRIGKDAGTPTSALITDMSQPLGNAIGNALEVREAIEILSGKITRGDLLEVSLALAAEMLIVSGLAADSKEARTKATGALESGAALSSLAAMIEAQGGDSAVCQDPGKLPGASKIIEIRSSQSGFLQAIDTAEIGMAALLLGAGRRSKQDRIDPAVGIWMHKRLGSRVEEGDILASFHVNSEQDLAEARQRFLSAIGLGPKAPEPVTLIRERIA